MESQTRTKKEGSPCSRHNRRAYAQPFDAAFISLQERFERLSKSAYHHLSVEQREALSLLECDSPAYRTTCVLDYLMHGIAASPVT